MSDDPPNAPIIPLFGGGAARGGAEEGTDPEPLHELTGRWVGRGFRLAACPRPNDEEPLTVEANATSETITFAAIGVPIRASGPLGGEDQLLGVHYVHQVIDAASKDPLHTEPGVLLHVPPEKDPGAEARVVRLANTPHGEALLADGPLLAAPGGPTIRSVGSAPIDQSTREPVTLNQYREAYARVAVPAGIPAGAIADPNVVLQGDIEGQEILSTTMLSVATFVDMGVSRGRIDGIPFAIKDAQDLSVQASFWIEKVSRHGESGSSFLQLQYSEKIVLSTNGIDWPHISVATLVRQ